ncbi:hypothetical protein AMJ49_05940 [Parcubacteria bacterium DG_74_2]|nr:MAG: hypothetical protein AMJ49_05940 [Parcubacteria bacterium DG_74_2]
MRKIKFIKGNFYHLFNRGVDKRNIFGDDNDKWRFLQGLFLFNDEKSTANLLWQIKRDRGKATFGVLRDFIRENSSSRDPLVRICAICLMPNHYHLLVEEIKEDGISRFMHKLGTGYVEYFNSKYDRDGSLFQATFKTALIDNETYLQYLLVYINIINPGQLIEPNLKEEGIKDIDAIMQFAKEYQWSTNPEYLNERNSIIIEKGLLGEFFPDPRKYQEFAKQVLLGRKFETISHLALE